MITKKVKWGKIGVNVSASFREDALILIQAEDSDDKTQTRVVLTIDQARSFIKNIENNIKIAEEKQKNNIFHL